MLYFDSYPIITITLAMQYERTCFLSLNQLAENSCQVLKNVLHMPCCNRELCRPNDFMHYTQYRNTDDASVHFNRMLFAWWLVAIEGGVFFAAVFLTVFVYNLLTMATVSSY